MFNGHRSVKILFIGQCLQYGYKGLERSSTYTSKVIGMLQSRCPHLSLKFDLKHLFFPTGLKAILNHRLMLAKPDIVIITVPASFAAHPWPVNMVYEMAPEIVDTARSFVNKIEARIKGEFSYQAEPKLIKKMFTWRQPMKMAEYEQMIEEGVRICQAKACRVLLIGPGGFNDDAKESFLSPELWSSVNEMVLNLGKRLDVPVVNTHDLMGEHGGEVYMPNNIRWNEYGHDLVAYELESVIASEVTALTLSQQLRIGESYDRVSRDNTN